MALVGGPWYDRRGPRAAIVVILAAMFVVVAAGPAAAASGSGGRQPSTTADPRAPRPDIVAIVLDDIPELDGRLLRRLPNIRNVFLDHGVEFTDFHGETPTCCPGRAGFLTGLHTHHHRTIITDGSLFKPGMTIATQLHGVGYYTIQVGKYLNLFEKIADKWPPGWSRFHGFGGAYYGYNMWQNGRRHYYGSRPADYSTDVIRRLTLAELRKAPRKRRLFAWITPYAFHKPWQVAPRHRTSELCTGIERWKPPGYMEGWIKDKPRYIRQLKIRSPDGIALGRTCRGLISVDQLVGRVVRELKDQGRWNNTLMILTSDNGMSMGMHRVYGDKKTPYATQLPFYIRWPRLLGSTPAVIGERLQNIDLAPTLCDIAGCKLGPYPTGQRRPDGRSFLSLITGARSGLARDAVLSSYRAPGKWVPRWWSVTTTARSDLASRRCALKGTSGCRWLYVEYETGERELYDVSNGPCWEWSRGSPGDPCMLDNLAGKPGYRGIQSALRYRLVRLR